MFKFFNREKPQSSIEGQVIQKFITVVAILLFVMWVVEIVFFTMFYENVEYNGCVLWKRIKDIKYAVMCKIKPDTLSRESKSKTIKL